ncbi:type III polyketide synthase [Mesorhizobium sp. RMAD-H1]|uniref:type III polyketide synthase n=1 Tax=Mesorhizobium sp. RMAD-H1 TaxID=2587065 RepID=UPI00161254E9|nr:type III polyketide synthase [Mesorhizobium sp. RMAD-H1]MBB2974353.1 alkylresorcinol/alkylpyrone synthase [Mesorhizobium sp. RMAD-H1]
MSPRSAKLVSLATALPPHVLPQNEVAAVARNVFGRRFQDFDRLGRVFDTAGIERRYGVCPIEWYLEEKGWPERTAVYLDAGADLFVAAARKALNAGALTAADIDTVVTVSSTGISTPSLEARVADTIGFRPDVKRVPIFGLGCAGGITGLAIASRLAEAMPGSTVLLVVVEVCTLAFRLDKVTKANLVATALFGDGAAACIVRVGEEGIAEVTGSGEHMWPGTLGIMGWEVEAQGFGVIFDRAIPPFAEHHLAGALSAILSKTGTDPQHIDRLLCHPGGAKVVTSIEQALALPKGALDHERAVLRDFGNMSAPTALFVLAQALRAGLPRNAAVLALGPGFTASCVTLARAT